MANFADYLAEQHKAQRQDEVGAVAGLFCTSEHGKIRSVSGVRAWFTDNSGQMPLDAALVDKGLTMAVREYNAQRDGSQTPGSPSAQAEWQAWVSGVLEGLSQRLGGIEAALTWVVDAMAAQSALSQAQMDTRSAQDYRDWAGGDQTRSEAAALGLVTPAPRTSEVRSSVANPPVDNEVPAQPGRSSVPGYENVLPPGTKPGPAGYEGVPAQPMDLTTYDAAILPAPPDYPEVDNSQDQLKSTSDDHGRLAHAMGLDADPALAAQREAIRAEAARIQRESPASSRETPPGAFYDESADVQEIAPQSYSAEQWRAWAMTSDIPDDQ